jgi:hypothetical protein
VFPKNNAVSCRHVDKWLISKFEVQGLVHFLLRYLLLDVFSAILDWHIQIDTPLQFNCNKNQQYRYCLNNIMILDIENTWDIPFQQTSPPIFLFPILPGSCLLREIALALISKTILLAKENDLLHFSFQLHE